MSTLDTTKTVYEKNCIGCKTPFQSNARNARYAPTCKCLEKKTKQRIKRRKERREYAKNPEFYKAQTRSRNAARKTVLAHFGVTVKSSKIFLANDADNPRWRTIGCNSPGCQINFASELLKEHVRRNNESMSLRGANQVAMKNLLRKLEAHHRDHDCFNNRFDSYPHGSNIELLCRAHHEQADRAKANKAQLVLWTEPPTTTWVEFLLELRTNKPRKFFTIPISTLRSEYEAQ